MKWHIQYLSCFSSVLLFILSVLNNNNNNFIQLQNVHGNMLVVGEL